MKAAGVLAIVLAAAAGAGAQRAAAPPGIVAQVGEYVAEYYAKATSVLVEEHVILQPLGPDMSFAGFPRRLVYELRLEWNPEPEPGEPPATILRELVRAEGPPLGPPDQPDCLDPRAVTPEPLLFLLPDRRENFSFEIGGSARVDGRPVLTIDYRPRAPQPPIVKWEGACGQVDLPGRMRGRLWVDPATGAVLRFDEHLVGPVDIPAPRDRRNPAGPLWFTFERADTTIHYRPVTFTDPDETVLLPFRIEGVTIIRNSGVPRLRVTQELSNYRRFVTESRIIH